MSKPIIRLVTCGSVDDGKSTLIGRLLVETGSVPDDTVDSAKTTRRSGSTIKAGDIDFSLLTDGLEAEREQGITIDVAYRSMVLQNGRRLIIADAPGHEQYTRNMAVAASRADIGLILLDATRGVRTQTLRHLNICSIMGVTRIAIVINKLDATGYDESVYRSLIVELTESLERLGVKDFTFIPVSALAGDNVSLASQHMPWYEGPTLLEYLQDWPTLEEPDNAPRLTVQMVNRAENFRGISGTIFGGEFKLNDEIVVLPTKKTAKISKIVTFDGDLDKAADQSAVTLVLEPDVDATRGDAIELASNFTEPANRFAATMVWLNESELIHSRSYYLISGSTQVPAMVTNIRHVLNINNGAHESARTLKANDIGLVEIATDAPIALAPTPRTGSRATLFWLTESRWQRLARAWSATRCDAVQTSPSTTTKLTKRFARFKRVNQPRLFGSPAYRVRANPRLQTPSRSGCLHWACIHTRLMATTFVLASTKILALLAKTAQRMCAASLRWPN